jgi:hypothetical protein
MKQEDAERLKSTVLQHFEERGFQKPVFYMFRPAAGAEVVSER